MKRFLSHNRREAIGRVILDTWKLSIPAALASGLFKEYNWKALMLFIVSAIVFLFLAVAILPSKSNGAEA